MQLACGARSLTFVLSLPLTFVLDPHEMPHNAAIHHLLRLKKDLQTKYTIFLTPRYKQWTIPSLLYQPRYTKKEESINIQKVRRVWWL